MWSLLLLALLASGVAVFTAAESRADQCKFCFQEMEDGTNPLRCPHCVETAQAIARKNARVWVLDFQGGEDLGVVRVNDDTGEPETYWYLPYTLTNHDENPHEFSIDVTAESDRGKHTARYHDIAVPDVIAEVRRVLGVADGEVLHTQVELSVPPPGQRNRPPPSGRESRETAVIALPVIQPGQQLKCVAMFQAIDPEMDRLTVSVRGLTNSSLLTHADYVIPEGEPFRRVVTEAVLTLHYRRPGDEFAAGLDPIEFVGRRWTDETRTIRSDLR